MKKKNNGYTLVEMIIVLGIMFILAGLAIVSIGVIHVAQYNSAANTFDNQLSNLWIQTKTVSQAENDPSVTIDSKAHSSKYYPLCMKIERNADESYSLLFGYHNGSDMINKDQEVVATLPKIIKIQYTSSDFNQESGYIKDADNKTLKKNIVMFNKSDGSVKYGAGKYAIIYDDSVVMTIHIDKATGKHYIK